MHLDYVFDYRETKAQAAAIAFDTDVALSKPFELSRRTGRRAVLGALLAVVAIAAGALTVAALGGPGRPTVHRRRYRP